MGDIDLGPFVDGERGEYSDPFYGDENKSVPQRFSIQYLTDNNAKIYYHLPNSDGKMRITFGMVVQITTLVGVK